MNMPRRLRASAAFGLLLAGGISAGSALAGPVVIELFTSQGCSNCPAADAFLAELAMREGIIALSLPVDIWDWRGWADTLANPAFTERQQGYYQAPGGAGYAYTPHMVVNGVFQVAGNDRPTVENAIAAAAANAEMVPIAISRAGSAVRVEVGDAIPNGPTWGTVWVVMYRTSETVNVANGDNAGLALTYTHVVVEMDRKDMWRGQALSFELPLMELTEAQADGCVVIIQQERDGMPGPIIGAIAYPLTGW
jgi:hypothetical protein